MALIQLSKNRVAIVDDDKYDWLNQWKWCCSAQGYAVRDSAGERLSMSRVLLGLCKGDPRQADHINGDRRDNRITNLRICSQAENNRNYQMRSDNTSGFKGVHWFARAKRWQAYINFGGKRKHIGYFDTAELASAAYEEASTELFGEFKRIGEKK